MNQSLPAAPSPLVVSRRVTLLTALMALVCIPLLLAIDHGSPSLYAISLLAATVVVTELRPVHVGRNGQRHSFTLTEGPLVAALALAPGRTVVIGVTVGVLLAQLLRGLPRYKVAFNVSQFAAASCVATLTAQLIGGSFGVLVGVIAFAVLNDSLVRLVISATTGRPAGRPMQDAGFGYFLHIAAVSSIALLGAHVYLSDPVTLPAFIAPALLVLWFQEQSHKRRAHTTVVNALAEQATAFYGRSSEETALLLTRTAREVLAAARAELVLLGNDSLVVFTADAGGVERTRLSHAELVTGWRGRVFESTTATAQGVWAGTVVGQEVPRALLGLWRDKEQEEFRPDDVALLQALADTVADWLSVSDEEASSILNLRHRVLDLGDDAQAMADALGMLATIRERLESVNAGPIRATSLAEDLKDVEQRISSFVGSLVGDRRTVNEDGLVVTGHWAAS